MENLATKPRLNFAQSLAAKHNGATNTVLQCTPKALNLIVSIREEEAKHKPNPSTIASLTSKLQELGKEHNRDYTLYLT